VHPTSLRSWGSGRKFRILVVLQAVVVGRSRSAADADRYMAGYHFYEMNASVLLW